MFSLSLFLQDTGAAFKVTLTVGTLPKYFLVSYLKSVVVWPSEIWYIFCRIVFDDSVN